MDRRSLFRQRWLIAAVAVAGLSALSLWVLADDRQAVSRVSPVKSAQAAGPKKTLESSDSKPICSQVIVPVGDCIPQHLANLPPDPGPAGKATLEGIDSDKDGVRDDLQRFIVLNWGHSERAVRALTLLAKNDQRRIQLGDSVTREQAHPIATEMGKSTFCFLRSVDPEIRKGPVLESMTAKAANTEERFKRTSAFEYQAAHQVYTAPPSHTPLADLCGYDPATLPN